jgi:guanine nucleotide-binding protein G(i) subunit alpha
VRHLRLIQSGKIVKPAALEVTIFNIKKSILLNSQSLVTNALQMGEEFQSVDNRQFAQWLTDNDEFEWDQDTAHKIKSLWNDETTCKLMENRFTELYLDDSAQYFVEHVERIGALDYAPTNEDILRNRVKTTGIVDLNATVNGIKVTIIDVGGQRCERKKWKQALTDVNLVIYVNSLSEYDQGCYEEQSMNRLVESLMLFQETMQSPLVAKTPMMILFNKTDIFKTKIAKVCVF